MVWQDSLDSIVWAAVFIWAGVVLFLAMSLGYSDEQGWSLFFLGAGGLVSGEMPHDTARWWLCVTWMPAT